MAAIFVGVAVSKYKASRSPHAQGFIEVDQVSFPVFFVFIQFCLPVIFVIFEYNIK
jgi:hypothetical protein